MSGVLRVQVEEEEVWMPDIDSAPHQWYPPSLDESKRQSTMISKDGRKIELVIESRISICGDQVMNHGIYNYTVDLDFFIGNMFVGVTTYQGMNGGNPMQSEYVHGKLSCFIRSRMYIRFNWLHMYFVRLGHVWDKVAVW